MKNIILIFIFTIFVVGYLLTNKNGCLNSQAKVYLINNKKYCLLTANNQEQWGRGLMYYKKPVNFDGMIFIFPKKEIRNFWNMNTYLDLDLYWMDDEKIVGKSYLQSIIKTKDPFTVKSSSEVNRVVEIIK